MTTPEQEAELIELFEDFGDTSQEDLDNLDKHAEAIVAIAIERLDDKVTLFYAERGDQLDAKTIGQIIDGDVEAFDCGIYGENVEERRRYSIDSLFEAALGQDFNAELQGHIKGTNAYMAFVEACEERDDSDPMRALMEHTGKVMYRIRIGFESKMCNNDTGDWMRSTLELVEVESPIYMPEEERNEAVTELLSSIQADPEALFKKVPGHQQDEHTAWNNRKAMYEILENASYGGSACFLVYLESWELYKAAADARNNNRDLVVKLQHPEFLIYDGWNGSGHSNTIMGNFEMHIKPDDIKEVFYCDEKGATSGYSWCDDIASIVKSSAESPIEYSLGEEVQPANQEVEA